MPGEGTHGREPAGQRGRGLPASVQGPHPGVDLREADVGPAGEAGAAAVGGEGQQVALVGRHGQLGQTALERQVAEEGVDPFLQVGRHGGGAGVPRHDASVLPPPARSP